MPKIPSFDEHLNEASDPTIADIQKKIATLRTQGKFSIRKEKNGDYFMEVKQWSEGPSQIADDFYKMADHISKGNDILEIDFSGHRKKYILFEPKATNESIDESASDRRASFAQAVERSKERIGEWRKLEDEAIGLAKAVERMATSGKVHGEHAAAYDEAVSKAERAARLAEKAQKGLIKALGGTDASWHGQQFWFQDLWDEMVMAVRS